LYLGDCVNLGDGVTLGDWVKLGDLVTSAQLNDMFRAMYSGSVIFSKWVTKERKSHVSDGWKVIEYPVGAVIEEPAARISDQQCGVGLHVFRRGYRPEWAGLCAADHDLIEIHVEVAAEDICFAGLPGNDAKLRVRKLRVLD